MFFICVRGVSNGAFTSDPTPGATRYLDVPKGDVPSPTHQVPRTEWLKRVLSTFPASADGKRTVGDATFFVHGYNTTVEDAAKRHVLLAAGLAKAGFKTTVISFDWPSGNIPIGYLEDRHDAKVTAMRLVLDGIRLLLKARRPDCDVAVHAVAHSMGAYVVREAFDDADDTTAAEQNWTANQIVFLAGDVSSASLSGGNSSSESLYLHGYRLTNYFNRHDEVLQVSDAKRVGLSPRVGRVGLPSDAPGKAVDVDCSKRYMALLDAGKLKSVIGAPSHSWYFHDSGWYDDLALTLKGSTDRQAFGTRSPTGTAGNSFRLT